MTKNKIEIVDGKIPVPAKATVHECMDFFHGLGADCKDPPTRERWTKDRNLVRINREKNELTIRASSTYSPAIVPDYYGTIDQYGVGQYAEPGKAPSNKIEYNITLDQGSSNFVFALVNSAFSDDSILKKTVWSNDAVEDHIKDMEKVGPINIATYLRSKCYRLHEGNGPFPLNVDRITIRMAVWVAADKGIAFDKRPPKRLGESYYGGDPYAVQDGGVVSGYLKIAKSVAGPYIARIVDGKLGIQKGDFASSCVRFSARHSVYAAGNKGEKSVLSLLQFSMRIGTFDMTVLTKTVNSQASVKMSDEDVERAKEMGGIVEDSSSEEEMSETSREEKRRRLNGDEPLL